MFLAGPPADVPPVVRVEDATVVAGCASVSTLRDDFVGFYGEPLEQAFPSHTWIGLRVAAAAASAGFEAHVRVRVNGEWTQRTLEAADCRAVARAAALVLAVSADAVRSAETIVEGAGAPTSSAPGSTGTVGLGLGVGAAVGLGPAPQAAGELDLVVERSVWRAEFGLGGVLPAREDYSSDRSVGARFGSLWARVHPCVVPGGARVVFPVCVGVTGGWLLAKARGVAGAGRGGQMWWSGDWGLGSEVRLSRRWTLALRLRGQALLRRPAFHIGDRPELFRMPSFAATGLLGVRGQF